MPIQLRHVTEYSYYVAIRLSYIHILKLGGFAALYIAPPFLPPML